MITSGVAAPAAINCGVCHRESFPTGLSSLFPSPSRKFSSLTATVCPIGKDLVRSFRTSEFRALCRVSIDPVPTKVENNRKNDVSTQKLESNLSLASIFKDVIISGRGASSCAKTSRRGKNPKRLSTNGAAESKNPLNLLPVIRYPLGTESAIKAMLECNTLVFVVDKRADKTTIKDSVEKMFKIRAKKVNTSITPDGTKKAYVMLAAEFNALDVAKRIKIF